MVTRAGLRGQSFNLNSTDKQVPILVYWLDTLIETRDYLCEKGLKILCLRYRARDLTTVGEGRGGSYYKIKIYFTKDITVGNNVHNLFLISPTYVTIK